VAASVVVTVAVLDQATLCYVMTVAEPQLWSPECPLLYQVRTTWGSEAGVRWARC
jgi:beta-galactosidase/beta-glucuronidase